MAKRFPAYLILLGFLLGNLIKIPIFRPDIKISPLDLALVICYIFAIFKKKNHISYLIFHNSIQIFIIWLFLTLIIGSLNLGFMAFLSGFAYFFRFCLYIFSYYPLSILFTKSEKKSLIVSLAVMFPILGMIQYVWFPDLRPFTIYGWDMHYYRVFGTYLDPGFFGLILIWSLLQLINKPFLWVISYIVLAFTYSRSSFLAFVLGFSRVSSTILLIILIGTTIILLPRSSSGEGVRLERTGSVVSRFDNWQESLQIFKKYPLIGTGFNLLRYQYQDKKNWDTSHAASGSDSSLIFVLTTSGLIGLTIYLKLLWHLWKYVRQDRFLSAFFIAIFVHSFFLNSQFYPPIILLFSLSLAFKADKTL